jgi:hypothetical protein
LPSSKVYGVLVNDSSASVSQTSHKISPQKSALPIWGVVVLWTIAIFCIGDFGRSVADKILPHSEEIVWNSQLQIDPHTTITIRAWRHGDGDFSQTRPLDDCEIAINGSHILGMGPNVSISHYTDQHGETIRGATPPDAPYIAGWLKDAGQSPAAAPQIAARVAPLFDFDKLNTGVGPDWSTVHTRTIPELSYVLAVIALVVLWLAGLLTILCISSAIRRRG